MKVISQNIWKTFVRHWTNLVGLLWQLYSAGGFEEEEESIAEFLNLCNLENFVKQKTCFKNPDKPTCIDLILTNCPRSFQNTDTFETGLSDFHKLTFTALKQNFPK